MSEAREVPTAAAARRSSGGRHRRSTGPGVLRRTAAGAAAAALVATTTMAFVPAGTATAAGVDISPAENADARTAVAGLAGDRPWAAAIPRDFPADAGYRPVLTDGLLVDPKGDCSSPIPLPAEFDLACKAHDLGYDMLRYADRHGQPLGAWARQAIDATLERRMYDACAARPDAFARAQCDVMATVAATAVDLNSRRQNYAAPVPEHLFGVELSGPAITGQLLRVLGPAALVLLAVAALIAGARRHRRLGSTGRPLPQPVS
ncbi:hypothetical protein [Nocardia transvalensis]|uniref:hypothetical protein n=1 Tax=Nocardia transvalensis TaxID=37333 RepID=UPI001894C895|nr:hypothetical protein [Nocardia transvalensis]MBF6329197.1 hypothetical protein [Nocardia transvalensis]